MAQIDAYNAIYDTLAGSGASFFDSLGTSTIQASGSSLYLAEGAQDETGYPICIITPVSDVMDKYFNTIEDDVNFEFQIDLYTTTNDNTAESLIALNDQLVTLLDETAITMTNHANASTVLVDRGPVARDQDTYRITSQWRLIATVTA